MITTGWWLRSTEPGRLLWVHPSGRISTRRVSWWRWALKLGGRPPA